MGSSFNFDWLILTNQRHRRRLCQNVQNAKRHIIIIGAGFAGLKLARTLNNHPNYSITLIDKNNYHQFQPLFYQVAMANLDASNFSYDYLVIAIGAVTNYFGNAAIEQYSFPMKSSCESSAKAKDYLKDLGVTVMLNTLVKEYNGRQLLLQNGNILESTFVIWAAGVKGNVPQGMAPKFVSKSSQISTDAYHKVIGSTNVYALGDVALMTSDEFSRSYPQLFGI